ncbi:MAG: dinitrogenase iron-molybdenum cofactor biosynthesis protein [bacterium]|nr:dinitrogenase iron-molybdenum cofactor biosynthesis protein [bacterium]
MKIAVTSKGDTLESEVSDVFGRCEYFIIADVEDKEIKSFEAVENISAKQMGGAGISAAKAVAEKDVKSVLTGNLGPRAADIFKQFNIESYKASGIVKDALNAFIQGKLEKMG